MRQSKRSMGRLNWENPRTQMWWGPPWSTCPERSLCLTMSFGPCSMNSFWISVAWVSLPMPNLWRPRTGRRWAMWLEPRPMPLLPNVWISAPWSSASYWSISVPLLSSPPLWQSFKTFHKECHISDSVLPCATQFRAACPIILSYSTHMQMLPSYICPQWIQ